VDHNRHAGQIPFGDKYCTHSNVDAYFTMVVATKMVRRIVLQRWADFHEYIVTPTFKVDETVVTQSLELQRQLYRQHMALQAGDPHANLPTDMMTEEEKIANMFECLRSAHPFWDDFVQTWTGFVRRRCFGSIHMANLRFAIPAATILTAPKWMGSMIGL
jgi:hypothetical protein